MAANRGDGGGGGALDGSTAAVGGALSFVGLDDAGSNSSNLCVLSLLLG